MFLCIVLTEHLHCAQLYVLYTLILELPLLYRDRKLEHSNNKLSNKVLAVIQEMKYCPES